MADPYRTPGVIATADDPPQMFVLEEFGGPAPDCPICTRHAESPGQVCYGRRTFWTRRHICPPQPHFHPKCGYCKHVWMMATRKRIGGQ